jgi:sarcosine oxidase subunit delta
MKLMNCPLNGPRNISEFLYGGELEAVSDPGRAQASEWAEHVFFHDNPAGVVREWWCHAATSYWFIAERHTVTDEILRTYPSSDVFEQRVEFHKEGE